MSEQPSLFDEQVETPEDVCWVYPDTECVFGHLTGADGFAANWDGPHHCAECAAEVERLSGTGA